MGTSTNAILAFGFDLGEEFEIDEKFPSEDGFDDWVIEQAGIKYPAGSEYGSPEYTLYSEQSEAAKKASPVEMITHCSGEYPMHFLAVRGTQLTASRGSPESITKMLHDGAPTPDQVEAMKAFCEKHDIEWKDPSWHIFSMWG